MFLIFPGHGSSRKMYDINLNTNTNRETFTSNFISEFKKIGKVHFVEPPWNNIRYYVKKDKNHQKLFNSKKLDFTLDDLNIKTFCSKIYQKVKDFDGKFVLIGHSIGSFFVQQFSYMYSSKCLFNILIDGTNWKIDKEKYKSMKQNTKNLSDIKINSLIKEVKNYDINSIDKLFKLTGDYILVQKLPDIKKLKVFTISFKNINMESTLFPDGNTKLSNVKNKIDNEEYILKYNPNKYRTIYFINKNHQPYEIKDSRDIILNTIKGYLL